MEIILQDLMKHAKKHFSNSTLSNNDLIIIGYLSVAALTVYGSLCLTIQNRRTRAWMISLINSFAMSVVGVYYFAMVNYEYPQFLLMGSEGLEKGYARVDNISCIICVWFAVANIFDLLFGVLFYREQLSLLTTYFHHPLFAWASMAFLTGNAIFLKCRPTPGGFALTMIEEIPTFLLALGNVFPKCRTDLGFGLTFFVFRVIYHGYLFIHVTAVNTGAYHSCIVLLTLSIHIHWFLTWARKYGKVFISPKKSIAEKKE